MARAFEIQKQVRENAETDSYLSDLQNWEADMKRKEAELTGAGSSHSEQNLPPVRSKMNKKKSIPVKPYPLKRIPISELAVDILDTEGSEPRSLDSGTSDPPDVKKLKETKEDQYDEERDKDVTCEKSDDEDKASSFDDEKSAQFEMEKLGKAKKEEAQSEKEKGDN